jgi:hypothetical protein
MLRRVIAMTSPTLRLVVGIAVLKGEPDFVEIPNTSRTIANGVVPVVAAAAPVLAGSS